MKLIQVDDVNIIEEFAKSKNGGVISSYKIATLAIEFGEKFFKEITSQDPIGTCPIHIAQHFVDQSLMRPNLTFEELFEGYPTNFCTSILMYMCFSMSRSLQYASKGKMTAFEVKEN